MVDKIDPSIAAGLYGNTNKIGSVGGIGKDDDGISFSDFLRDKAQESVEVLRTSEQTSAKAVTGEADVVDVVQAVNAAEMTLNTVVAVRDRLISAYQEIMRMPI